MDVPVLVYLLMSLGFAAMAMAVMFVLHASELARQQIIGWWLLLAPALALVAAILFAVYVIAKTIGILL